MTISKVKLIGRFNEKNWGPMTEEYIFNNDGSFQNFYFDDTHGSFGKGKFYLTRRTLHLDYDSIELDNPILSKFEVTESDSVTINLTIMDIGDDNIRFINEGEIVKETNLKDYRVSATFKRPIEKIKIQVYTEYIEENNNKVLLKEEINSEFEIFINGFSCCSYDYYPSNSWFSFNTDRDEEKSLKRLTNTHFEYGTKKLKWIFEKE